MPWTVVEFKDSNTVEAVPSSWIQGNECFWPPFSREKVGQEIKKNEPPNSCWPLFKIRIFRNGTYDNYAVARQKARKAEDTSDLNSEIENKKRKRLPRRMSSSSSSENESANLHPNISSELPVPPQELLSGSILSQNEENCNGQSVTESKSTNKCSCCIQHQNKVESFLKEILKKNSVLRAHLLQISDSIAVLGKSNSLDEPNPEDFFMKFTFPLNDPEQIAVLEEYLLDEVQFVTAVHRLTRVGGNSIYDFVRRCLGLIFTNRLAEQYSYYGKKGKQEFRKLKVCQLVLDAAQKHGNYTLKDGEDSIKKWLKRAKERK